MPWLGRRGGYDGATSRRSFLIHISVVYLKAQNKVTLRPSVVIPKRLHDKVQVCSHQ
ncbi:hypothetical protein MKW92_000853 [Papaver armeniacum]|nr:hypothetical protein MKW92_000853 [Papaver armeniacum]